MKRHAPTPPAPRAGLRAHLSDEQIRAVFWAGTPPKDRRSPRPPRRVLRALHARGALAAPWARCPQLTGAGAALLALHGYGEIAAGIVRWQGAAS